MSRKKKNDINKFRSLNPYYASFEVRQPQYMYQAIEYPLPPADEAYALGYRIVVEQADGTPHFFCSSEGDPGSTRFCAVHGLLPIPIEDMDRLRQTMADESRDEQDANDDATS